MAPNDFRPGGRAKLEKELLQQLRYAEQAYQAATKKLKTLATQYNSLPSGQHDHTADLQQAAQMENDALENYHHILQQFTDLILRGGKPPDDPE
jgi:rubrerythrin